jgi:hypothetical protein
MSGHWSPQQTRAASARSPGVTARPISVADFLRDVRHVATELPPSRTR